MERLLLNLARQVEKALTQRRRPGVQLVLVEVIFWAIWQNQHNISAAAFAVLMIFLLQNANADFFLALAFFQLGGCNNAITSRVWNAGLISILIR